MNDFSQNSKRVSIVVPAKNEEEQIANTIEGAFSSMGKFNINGEIIAVNDGSSDLTGKILEDFKKKYVNLRVVTHEKSQGLGAAFLAGLALAKMDYIFLLPGDNENDPSSVLGHVKNIQNEDVLITYVTNTEARSLSRQKISRIYTFIINKSFGYNLKYFNGTSLYKISSIKNFEIKSQGFFFSAEILLKLLKSGASYKEVPIALTNIKQTKSSAISIRAFRGVIKGFLYMIYWQYISSIKGSR